MVSRAARLIVRALRIAPILTLMFSGCTCSEKTPDGPTPTVAVQVQTPTSAARPTDTVSPPTPTTAAQAAEPSPAAGGAGAIQDNAKRTECEGYIDALSGRAKDPTLLDKPEVRALANADLVTCGAVFSDSDVACKRLMPVEHGPGTMCRRMWSTFHELRAYPKSRSFMFEDVDWEECRTAPFPGPAVCDAFRSAMRSGDATNCAATGVLQSICRAYIALDPSLCRLEGTLKQTTIELPDKKEDGKIDIKNVFEENCRRTIAKRAPLAAGLEALAKSGGPQEQAFAKAALGQTDACAAFATTAMQACTAAAAPTPPAPAAPAPAPATTPAAPAPNATPAKNLPASHSETS